MEAIGYARISVELQSQNSIPGQVADITAYCQRNNLTLHKIFIDQGQSAFNFNRKEWKQVESYLKENKKVKFLVIYSMDRFSRANLVDALSKMDEIQKRTGVKILTVSDPVNLDLEDFGTDLRRIMELMFSNYELKKIRKRTSDGLYTSMASGRWTGKAPYGYINKRDENGKPVIMVDEEKAYLVRMIFRQYISGMQLEEIRKHGAANGMKLKGNSAIRRILSNPLYAGLIKLPKHGMNPSKIIKGIHSPIVSESDYWSCQRRLTDKRIVSQRREEVFLRGVLTCKCGRRMTAGNSRGKSGKYFWYYKCPDHKKNFPAKRLHEQFLELLDYLSLPSDAVGNISDRFKKLIDERVGSKTSDLMRAKLNLEKIQDRISSTEEKYLRQPDISERVYKKVISELRDDEHRMQFQISELNADGSGFTKVMKEILPKLSNVKGLFKGWALQKQHSFLGLVFPKTLYYADGIYRTPLINPFFAHNVLGLKKKGLLIVEQPQGNIGNTPGSSGNGNCRQIDTIKALHELICGSPFYVAAS